MNITDDKRKLALERASELKEKINDYLDIKDIIPIGRKLENEFRKSKEKILMVLKASEKDWANWKWQMRNRISNIDTLNKIINLTEDEIKAIKKVGEKYRWAVSPYYASLMSVEDPDGPIRKQSLPNLLEQCDVVGSYDPMGEEYTSPAPGITRRYPDRLIINVTNQCAMYCRHCQRRRNIGEIDKNRTRQDLVEAIEYIKVNPEIRDVLITGGDSLLLSDTELDWLLSELDAIEHVEIKRLGTRTLVTLPQRITPELCAMLEKHHPLYINTQFNHPKEITEDVVRATNMLSKAGIPLGNQAVLLKGINNNPHVMKKLNHELLKVRIRPYYIFHAKSVAGTEHFITRVDEGIEIMEKLRGFTSGLAIPTYIINAPKGYGKTPMLPEYLISFGDEKITIRTWENRVFDYPNTES